MAGWVRAQMHLVGRALLQPGVGERVLVVRDDEPTSLVAYALTSQCAPSLSSLLSALRAVCGTPHICQQ